jgi:hypothetical protein
MQADSRPIQVKNSSTELDLYLLQLDGNALTNNIFLARVRKQLERYDIQLTYDFGWYSHRKHGITTKSLDGSIKITIFKQNAITCQQGMLAIVHESSHAVVAAKGRTIGTQIDEYRAFRREFLFQYRRRPSFKERFGLFKLVRELYSQELIGHLPSYFKNNREE